MADAPTDDLAPGFYWISLDGIGDGHPAEVVVLGGPLPAPP
jgi:hypothetical protein